MDNGVYVAACKPDLTTEQAKLTLLIRNLNRKTEKALLAYHLALKYRPKQPYIDVSAAQDQTHALTFESCWILHDRRQPCRASTLAESFLYL